MDGLETRCGDGGIDLERKTMPVHLIHATVGVLFFTIWALIGNILVRSR